MNPEKFWVVWCPSRGAPSVQHNSRESATAEAERLAATLGGFVFYVLGAVSVSQAIKPVATTELPAKF